MKQWIMPQVKVEQFVANEYVAACGQGGTKPIPTSGTYAADIFNNRTDKYGMGDTYYDGLSFEGFVNGGVPSTMKNYGYNTKGMWFTNVKLYSVKGSPHMNDDKYSDSKYFTLHDTYDIYISAKGVHMWAYPAGTHEGDPSLDPDTKPWS